MEEQKRIKYFIDFDDTLFDRKRFWDKLEEVFAKHGFTSDEILASYKAVYDTGYAGMRAHLDHLYGLHKDRYTEEEWAKLEEDIFDFLESNHDDCLFPETMTFLSGIDKNKYDVYIITVGNTDFQKAKVEGSGVAAFFDESHLIYCEGIEKDKELTGDKAKVKPEDHFILLEDKSFTRDQVKAAFPNAITLPAKDGDLMKYIDPEASIAREGQIIEPVTESVSQSHEQEASVVESENPSSEEGGSPRIY